ncbi:hypothetical protein MUK42_33950 [Musa troglodytarum]|uniref:Uncharacterized protein n=1 Tax=Musa troglodytarum TaxID=320322 RepID=A0A9E7JCS5_9LILI|nr:hypothetical protein MUK42_33950 [Musa troglodytarum]
MESTWVALMCIARAPSPPDSSSDKRTHTPPSFGAAPPPHPLHCAPFPVPFIFLDDLSLLASSPRSIGRATRPPDVRPSTCVGVAARS